MSASIKQISRHVFVISTLIMVPAGANAMEEERQDRIHGFKSGIEIDAHGTADNEKRVPKAGFVTIREESVSDSTDRMQTSSDRERLPKVGYVDV